MTNIKIAGGVYRERCMWPTSDEFYGSAGRAACAIAKLGGEAELYSYADVDADEVMTGYAMGYGFAWKHEPIDRSAEFYYVHGLATPSIRQAEGEFVSLKVKGECVLRYGMLEGSVVVDADYAVYDPQDAERPELFHQNGSKANHLALVLNEREAGLLLKRFLPAEQAIEQVAATFSAEVVVLKCGARGALVLSNGKLDRVPAYSTTRVSKIGSGDQFVANFAFAWMIEKRGLVECVDRASRATAFYCQHNAFPTPAELDAYDPQPLTQSTRWLEGFRPRVYLAGPFFTLAQLWMVEQAKRHLEEMGLLVSSPYHDVGPGEAEYVVPRDLKAIEESDLIFAIGDGLDSGTVFEIGYARSEGLPVVVYVEHETRENLKMMEGSDCFMCRDFVSAIYRTGWIAASL